MPGQETVAEDSAVTAKLLLVTIGSDGADAVIARVGSDLMQDDNEGEGEDDLWRVGRRR